MGVGVRMSMASPSPGSEGARNEARHHCSATQDPRFTLSMVRRTLAPASAWSEGLWHEAQHGRRATLGIVAQLLRSMAPPSAWPAGAWHEAHHGARLYKTLAPPSSERRSNEVQHRRRADLDPFITNGMAIGKRRTLSMAIRRIE